MYFTDCCLKVKNRMAVKAQNVCKCMVVPPVMAWLAGSCGSLLLPSSRKAYLLLPKNRSKFTVWFYWMCNTFALWSLYIIHQTILHSGPSLLWEPNENQMNEKNQNPNNHFLLSKRERESWEDHTENAGLPHFILLHFTVLHRYHVFHKLKGFGKSALNKSIGTISPNSICSLHVSGSHLGNSCNTTSNVCIITICFGNPWSVISYCNCLGTPQTMPI